MSDCQEFQRHLTPYVDGEVEAAVQGDLEAHAEACPVCRADARAEQQARDLVRDRTRRLVPLAPASLVARCEAARTDRPARVVPAFGASRLRRWVPLSLAATLLLAVGGAFVFSFNSPVAALSTQLTLDHLKCLALADGAVSPDGAGAVAEVVSRVCGRPFPVPGDEPAEGFRLVGARRCFSTDGQAAHVLYELDGHPVSLFVLAGESKQDRKFEIMGHQTLWWSQGGATYALVSRSADGVMGAAAAIARRATR
jgi:anti-sigma factor RsiW